MRNKRYWLLLCYFIQGWLLQRRHRKLLREASDRLGVLGPLEVKSGLLSLLESLSGLQDPGVSGPRGANAFVVEGGLLCLIVDIQRGKLPLLLSVPCCRETALLLLLREG